METGERDKEEEGDEEEEEEEEDGSSFYIEDFDMVKTVGTGTFARVCLCRHVPSSQHFAMKILSLHQVVSLNQTEHVKNEKRILQEVRHPFIVPLLWSFKSRSHLFFLFPYVAGGEMFSYLRKARRFPLDTTLFYSAEIVSALSYLHSLSIVYRDLKPENILLDKEGHVIITDFGFAKKVPDRTWTLCGTPDYLAPEIIQSKGHNKAVDWWALGILIFEMLAGYPPFYDEDPMATYEKIITGKIKWSRMIDPVSKDLIEKLLTQDRTKRLGSMKEGAEGVMKHRFFQNVDWLEVYYRQLKPPIVPTLKQEADTENFAEYPEEDWKKVPLVSQREYLTFSNF